MIDIKSLESYIVEMSISIRSNMPIDMAQSTINCYIYQIYENVVTSPVNTIWVHDGKIDYIIMSIHDTKDDSKYAVACDINDAYKSKINNIQVHQIDSEQKDTIPGFHFIETDYLVTPTAIYHERKIINIELDIYTKLSAIDDDITCLSDYYHDLAVFCSENFDLSYSIPLFKNSLLFGSKNVYLITFDRNDAAEIYDKTKYIYLLKNRLEATQFMNYLVGDEE